MKKEKRHWKKQLAIDIVYYVGLVFLIKLPEIVSTSKYKWKKFKEKNQKNLGEKRF